MRRVLVGIGVRSAAAIAPGAHAASVNMYEPRLRIVAHTAAAKSERRISQRKSFDPWNADINRLRLHMEAAFGDPRGMRTQVFVAPWCSIAANNLNLRAGASHGCSQFRKDVKYARIVMLHFSGAMIAQKIIQLLLSFRQENIAPAINDINPLSCVRVVQAETMHVGVDGLNRRRARALSRHQHEHARNEHGQGNREFQTQNASSAWIAPQAKSTVVHQ